MDSVYIHPGVSVEEDRKEDVLDEWGDYLSRLFNASNFMYLFLLQLMVLLFACWCFYSNKGVVELATLQLHPSLAVFYLILALVCILPAFITYDCMRENRLRIYVWYALIFYDITIFLWCVTVLFERWELGTGIIMALLFVLSTVWYLVVSLSINTRYVSACSLLVFLALYMLYYAYNVR